MAAEVALTFSTLRTQLENEKNKLQKIDESIKKVVQTGGRFQNDRFKTNNADFQRGASRLARNSSFQEDDKLNKRKHETKTVFSRLSVHKADSDNEDEYGKKPRILSQVIRDLPSKQDVLKAQGGDEVSKNRNRRMFGSLLGTLQKFKQEEIELKNKEDKKALIEKKIEDQAKLELENRKRERQHLFAEREAQKANIKLLEVKMNRIEAFEQWESAQNKVCNYILTKAKPHLYWLPKVMTEKASEKLAHSKKYNEKLLVKKRQELQDELVLIETKLKSRYVIGNKPENNENELNTTKREKFSQDQKINDEDNVSNASSPAREVNEGPQIEKTNEETAESTNMEVENIEIAPAEEQTQETAQEEANEERSESRNSTDEKETATTNMSDQQNGDASNLPKEES